MKLIVGLGNPGRYYANNRHNIGFMCLNHFARTHSISFNKKKGLARIGTGIVAASEVVLAKPQTYMNLSGQSVSRLVRQFNISLDDLIVIHDDLDLPTAKIRIRRDSGSGGHQGVDSIITGLGSRDFTRIRIGIGRPDIPEPDENDIINYVLSDFGPEEKITVTQTIPEVGEAISCLISEDLATAMNKFN